jgi:hypothetical protein
MALYAAWGQQLNHYEIMTSFHTAAIKFSINILLTSVSVFFTLNYMAYTLSPEKTIPVLREIIFQRKISQVYKK